MTKPNTTHSEEPYTSKAEEIAYDAHDCTSRDCWCARRLRTVIEEIKKSLQQAELKGRIDELKALKQGAKENRLDGKSFDYGTSINSRLTQLKQYKEIV